MVLRAMPKEPTQTWMGGTISTVIGPHMSHRQSRTPETCFCRRTNAMVIFLKLLCPLPCRSREPRV